MSYCEKDLIFEDRKGQPGEEPLRQPVTCQHDLAPHPAGDCMPPLTSDSLRAAEIECRSRLIQDIHGLVALATRHRKFLR